jgi:hypothetical protein
LAAIQLWRLGWAIRTQDLGWFRGSEEVEPATAADGDGSVILSSVKQDLGKIRVAGRRTIVSTAGDKR